MLSKAGSPTLSHAAGSGITVGEVASLVPILTSFDFSSIDWNEVRKYLSDAGLYSSEVAAVIDQFASGNFSSLFYAIDLVNTISSLYPANMSYEDAVTDYFGSGDADYSALLPDEPVPSDISWPDEGTDLGQVNSPKVFFDLGTDMWQLDVDVDSAWVKDELREFAISKTVGSFFDQAEQYLIGVGERFGLPNLYQQVKQAKKLYNDITNFHTNMFNSIDKAIDGEISPYEFDDQINNHSLNFVENLTGAPDNIKDGVRSIGSGIIDRLFGGGDGDKMEMGAAGDGGSFHLAFSPVTGSFRGSNGVDGIVGGAGRDKIKGLKGADLLHGLEGKDHIVGGGGADTLIGGRGADTLIGGAGKDKLLGGQGADRFVFKAKKDSPSKKKADVILDFRQKQDDKLVLKKIDAKKGKGNQKFDFIGDDDFSGKKGELRFDHKNKKTFVYGDTNGDGNADFVFQLKGKIDLVKDDFVL